MLLEIPLEKSKSFFHDTRLKKIENSFHLNCFMAVSFKHFNYKIRTIIISGQGQHSAPFCQYVTLPSSK